MTATPDAGRAVRQSFGTLLMIRPLRFGSNPETVASNVFQSRHDVAQGGAGAEFDGFVDALRQAGLAVIVFPAATEETPDALFPNNWVSFHQDGTVVIYPMLAPSRRAEVRRDVIEGIERTGAFAVRRLVDLSHLEREGEFLEGTGSLVLDRLHRVAYANLSSRTTRGALAEFSRLMDYEIVAFEASEAGVPIYHTNVLLALGTGFAVLCGEAITDAGQRALLQRRLEADGREVIAITRQQMRAFAGNLLEVAPERGGRRIVLSTRAEGCLRDEQRERLARHGALLAAPLDTIEALGGGSARCMIAEIASPR